MPSHESITERALRLPRKKKSHKSSWDKAKAREEEQIEEQRRAIKHTQLVNDMRELQKEIRSRRKRLSIFSTIREFFS